MNEVCKMCFGSGHLLYSVTPPKVCPRCKGKGVVKIRKDSNLIPIMIKIFYWLRRIGIIALILLLLALFYVWFFVN